MAGWLGLVSSRLPGVLLGAGLLIALPAPVPAEMRLPPGAIDVDRLMARSSLVCKGRVTRVRLAGDREDVYGQFVRHVQMSRVTIKADRCYQGAATGDEIVLAVVDVMRSEYSGPSFRAGEYVLLFARAAGGGYELTDPPLGKLPASEGPPGDGTDSPPSLEADLKASLSDGNREVVIVALRLLAGMKEVQSTRELKELLPTTDRRVEGLVYLGLIKQGDYTLLGEAGRFVESGTRERDWSIHQMLVATAIGAIADSGPLPTLHEFTRSTSTLLRRVAVSALRGIRSRESVVTLMSLLDDASGDVRYGALMGVAEIDDSALERAPSRERFDRDEAKFIRRLKDWWNRDGRKKYVGE